MGNFTGEIVFVKGHTIVWEYKAKTKKELNCAIQEHINTYSKKEYLPVKILTIQFKDWLYGKRGLWSVTIKNRLPDSVYML